MLIDTSGLLCLIHKDEPEHIDSVTTYSNAKSFLTHNYILDEFVALANVRGFCRGRVLVGTFVFCLS